MKKAGLLFTVILASVAFMGCNKGNNGGRDPEPSRWGKPLKTIVYSDTKGTVVDEITIYSYDPQGRLSGYRRTSEDGGRVKEEMTASKYSGTEHTYEVHEYEWDGVPLPVLFKHTDTYADNSFGILKKRVRTQSSSGVAEITTYEYDGDLLKSYHTYYEPMPGFPESVVENKKPRTIRVIYLTGIPTEASFPEKSDTDPMIDIIYMDRTGNRTGYFCEVDAGLTEWNFSYYDGYCTHLRKNSYRKDNRLVRVVFYPDIF